MQVEYGKWTAQYSALIHLLDSNSHHQNQSAVSDFLGSGVVTFTSYGSRLRLDVRKLQTCEALKTMLMLSRHLIFTIPPAVVLTIILRPLATKIDLYKIVFLVSVCISSTKTQVVFVFLRFQRWLSPTPSLGTLI